MAVIDSPGQVSHHAVDAGPAQLLQQRADPHPYRVVAVARYAMGLGIDRTAEDYGIPGSAVEQALAFYQEHRSSIEARLSQEPLAIVETDAE